MVNFKTEEVRPGITRIYGICTELMYLVEGEKKAALIDTGSGFGSLKAVVEKLTDKPVIVLLTHGHTDHAMGAGEFDTVYMNREDDYIYGPHGEEAFRWDGLEISPERGEVVKEDYIPTDSPERFRNLSEGDSFDLGGRTIEIYGCGGHTRGSVVMLLKEDKILFLGDACNGNTFLFEDYSLSISEYEENLKALQEKLKGKYDTPLAFHGDGCLPVNIIEEVIDVCEDIKAGRTDDIPILFKGNHGFQAKETDPKTGKRKDGKTGNIVYNKDNI